MNLSHNLEVTTRIHHGEVPTVIHRIWCLPYFGTLDQCLAYLCRDSQNTLDRYQRYETIQRGFQSSRKLQKTLQKSLKSYIYYMK